MAEIVSPNFGEYPWHEWTDGRCRRVAERKDFSCARDSFLASLYAHAKRHGLTVRARRVGSDAVEFQFSGDNRS